MKGAFLEEILKCMDILDETANDTFSEFLIVKPKDSIDEFMGENAEVFKQRGWSMVKDSYSNPRRPGTVDKTPCIRRNLM